jgi:hypothetical protein
MPSHGAAKLAEAVINNTTIVIARERLVRWITSD